MDWVSLEGASTALTVTEPSEEVATVTTDENRSNISECPLPSHLVTGE